MIRICRLSPSSYKPFTRARQVMVLGIIAATALATASARERVLIDSGWRFQLGDPWDVTTAVTSYPEIPNLAKLELNELTGANSETNLQTTRPDPVATHAGEGVSYVLTNYNDSAWRALDLPHDWAVELPFNSSADGSHGFKPVGNTSFTTNNIGWYRRTFTLPSGDAGKVTWLDFDGIYRNALIWFNGHCIGRDVSGYAPISFDVTPYVNAGGTNVLVVRVDANRFEGWFYEGAGIYRHVWLEKTDPMHVAHWGTYVATTSLVGSNATITVQTTVTNQSSLTVTGSLASAILDANSNAVTAVTSNLTLTASQGLVVTQTLAMTNAKLWSLQSPYLYNLVSTVSNATALADVYQTPFGVRTVRIDATNGVFINGQHVWIQGMCNHQDHAGVGSALPDRLQYFRIERLKQMGVNAYRTSHNAPTAELLEACDRLGILVLDETRRVGTDPESLGQLRRMILRDRNHPSIFCWSLANEESLQGDSVNGTPIMQAMQNLTHSLDSTRPCTAAMSGGWGSGFSLVLDVTGFNYSLGSVDWYHSTYSTSNIIGTETSSQITDRGIYTNDAVNGYVWGYDLNPVSWGETAEAWWQFYAARPWSSGGFCWTGFDYRGEPTPYWWPCINSHFGILDTCGFPKDIFYYYQANWTLKPVLHILPHWNWAGREGQPINVWVFGNCDLVDLFLNGVSQGQRALNVLGHAEWNVAYAAGTLQAIGYRNGQAVMTNTVQTTGTPAAIALWPDRGTILADGRDISVVTVAVLDSSGRVVPTATNLINFTVSSGTIIGVGNGNPSSHEADKASQRSVFNGLAQVIVQSTNQPGLIVLTATNSGLISTNVTITAAASSPAPAAPSAVAAIATNQQNVISWDVVPGAITYNVKRSTTNGGPYSVIAANTAAIGFTDTNVNNLTAYYYVVTAVNAFGESVNSLQVSGTPHLPPVPTVPTGVTATRGDTQVTLSWTGASGAASYNVKRGTSGGGPYPTVTNVTTTSLVVTGLANGTTYYFVVSALNTTGESGNSSEVNATPMAFVSGLTANVVSSQVQLQWNAHAGATSYNVKRALVSGGPYTTIASNLVTTSFTDTTVSTCQTYYYVVTMMIGGVESVPSSEASATVQGPLPSPMQSADVGSVTPAGSAAYCSGQYDIAGSGADIWDVADAFQFVYVYVPSSTNCEIRARVVSLDNTHPNAKAAVMIRESLAAGSRHALADVEPSSGIELLWRTDTGGTTTASVVGGQTAPNWVRLTRTNNTFTASWSTDGNSWSQIGSASITMSNGAYVGLAVCSHNNGTLCSAVFDNVYISALAAAGSPVILQQPVGGTRYAGGSITLSASFSGSTPLSYQWRQNGTPVSSGSTNGLTVLLTLSGLTTNQAGNYTLYVTNSYGYTNTTAATVTVLPLTQGSYAEMIVTNNPVSYWRLNETGTPATAYDYVGGNDLANTSVVSTQGVQGFGYETTNPAAWYNGTNAGSAGSAPLMNSMTKFTICGWFKAASMPQPSRTALFGQNDLAEFGFHNSVLGIWIASPVGGGVLVTNPTATLVSNTWYFAAATADGTNVSLYLNGSLLKSLPGTVTNYYNSTDPFRIGYAVLDSSGNYFKGAIDEVALFNRALTASQLQALYNVVFAVPNVVMSIQPIGTNVTLIWSPAVGTLQSAPDVSGAYTNVPGATVPYTNPVSGPQKFFRVRVQ